MKKFILILLIAFGTTINAQSRKDSVIKNSIQIIPIVVTPQGDTATQLNWYAFDVQRDTLSSCNTNVSLYNRKGDKLYSYNQIIPSSIRNLWIKNPTPIDDYIISKNPRLKRKP